MALIFACRNVLRPSFKSYAPSIYSLQSVVPFNTTGKQCQETFFEKNQRLKRPLSPHLTVYKLQITSMLSLTHRATGIVLTAGLYAFSIGTLLAPASFPYYFEYLQSFHIAAPIIFSLKFSLSWPLFYHMANGLRHLVWDMGYGFDMKTLQKSGYMVLGISLLASAIAASV